MLDPVMLYDALYLLAAADGREAELFGGCQPLAREAFSRSLIGNEFPTVWFEVPLAGKPRFDLHVAFSRAALGPGTAFARAGVLQRALGALGTDGDYEGLFRWYAEEEPGGLGLALAYDVHVNVNNAPLAHMGRFFELAAGEGAAERYRAFADRLPQGWRVWYAGFHPGRPGTPVRVDCFVDDALKAAYAADPALFEQHVRCVGFVATGEALRDLSSLVIGSPFSLELQFDVLADGSVGPTVGVSAGFKAMSAPATWVLFGEGGAACDLMRQLEGRGLADKRWRRVAETTFAKLVDPGCGPLVLRCAPTFVKLRIRDGRPLDAKAYLQASAVRSMKGSRGAPHCKPCRKPCHGNPRPREG